MALPNPWLVLDPPDDFGPRHRYLGRCERSDNGSLALLIAHLFGSPNISARNRRGREEKVGQQVAHLPNGIQLKAEEACSGVPMLIAAD